MVYKPLSPVPWPYLTHPYVIVLSLNVAILIHILLEVGLPRPSLRLGVVLLAILASGIVARPRYCGVGESRRAIAALERGRTPEAAPMGYIEPGSDPGVASYPWRDYRAVLLTSGTRRRPGPDRQRAPRPPRPDRPGCPAAGLPRRVDRLAGRRPGRAALAALEDAGDETLVVWRGGGEAGPRVAARRRRPAPRAAVRRHYEPMLRFGTIEVWRRKGSGHRHQARAATEPPARGGQPFRGD